MPKRHIEKDAIVEKAYALAQSDGLKSVSIRAVADACGVSVGSIYNYFPGKDDLVGAVIGRFFTDAFYKDFCHPSPEENFLAYCERLFASMQDALSRFRSDWLVQIRGMDQGVRDASKKLETECLMHMRQGLEHVLENDPGIRDDAFAGGLDTTSLCGFVVRNMMEALQTEDGDCQVLFALMQRALY